MAAGAVRELNREGWPVPARISVASADFSTVATASVPRITAAGSNPELLGEAAAQLLFDTDAIGGDTFTDLTLPAQLFVGETTGRAAAG
jgi:LacI family transcriptional regulator